MSGTSLSMPKSMPAPRAKEAPRFKGKYLKDFLDEFEILAKAAGISEYPMLSVVITSRAIAVVTNPVLTTRDL